MKSSGLGLAWVCLAACSPEPRAPAPPALPTAAPIDWISPLERAHPLVGKIWDVKAARFVMEGDVRGSLRGFVLLGEKHDNPDHHVLQARMLRAMVEAGRKPVVAFEQLDVDDAEAIALARKESPHDPAGLARAAHWEKSGWPPWSQYSPIAQIALDADLAIVPTGLARAKMTAMMKHDDAVPIDTGVPLSPDEDASLRAELLASHCGQLPEAHVGGMVRFQRARDAAMATALISAADAAHASDGVLVAGTGHTRRDRGAAKDLIARGKPTTSIAFVEVERGNTAPTAYAVHWNTTVLPFDFVWFTPQANDDDPCAGFGGH